MLKSLVVGAAIAALTAGSASATITIIDGGVPGNPDENVLLNKGTSGTTVFGNTNQTQTSVTFKGLETLTEPANGQARIEAVDGAYTSLNFFLTDPTLAFGRAEFNINALASGSVTINAVDQFGNPFSGVFALNGNGQNFFNLTTANGELIKNVTYTSTVPVADTRQVRLGGFATAVVPEPSSWALLIVGFGMVGAGLRLRRRMPTAAA